MERHGTMVALVIIIIVYQKRTIILMVIARISLFANGGNSGGLKPNSPLGSLAAGQKPARNYVLLQVKIRDNQKVRIL